MALIHLAVVLSGLGGLVAELVLVRRYGLLLGNTSEASGMVLAAYLLGLGVGGLCVPAARRAVTPLAGAALAYGAVAVALLATDGLLRRLGPLSFAEGFAFLVVTPGLPTFLMGLAFPLVFSALGRGVRPWQVGVLAGANLAGSLVGAALGGNWWIPAFGLDASLLVAAAAYAGASLLLLGARRARTGDAERAEPPGRPARPRLGWLALAAAASGCVVIGFQVLLLRRLPFFLEGFQPTLSGVIAACLFALTLGSAVGTGVLARLFRERAAAAALILSGLAVAAGLHEHAVLPLSRLPVASELGMHARIGLCALAASGPTCFFLGAVVPLCVARFADPAERSVVAGRLFFWQGVGSVAGALLVGHAVPALGPGAFFVAAPLVLAAVAVLAALPRMPGLALPGLAAAAAASVAGISGAGSLFAPEPPLARPTRGLTSSLRFVDHATDSMLTASVAYDRSRHSMVLFTNEFRATETGPFADYMKVLGHLPFLLRDDLERAAVIAFGTGTTAKSVTLWPDPVEIHLVEISGAVLDMAPHFAGEAPLSERAVPSFLRDPRARLHVTDGRRFLALRDPESLDLVTIEPLLPYAPGTAYLYTREFYDIATRALTPRGLMMQWVPTHALPGAYFDTLLATFARSFAHTSAWFIDGATLLVGSEEPHLPAPEALEARFSAAPPSALTGLHEAGIASPADVGAALVGTRILTASEHAGDLHDERPFVERVGIWKYDGSHRLFFRRNHALLAEVARHGVEGPFGAPTWQALREHRLAAATALHESTLGGDAFAAASEATRHLVEARGHLPESVLLHVEETLALRFARAHQMNGVGPIAAGRIAREHLRRDGGSPIFQAARALPALAGEDSVLPKARAAELAVAIDPTFFDHPPFFLAHLPAPVAPVSPLETLEHLPEGSRLAASVVGDEPLAVALRAAYRVRSAKALLERLGERPLAPAEARALAPLLDPHLFREALAAVASRGGSVAREILPLWREDLPLPAALASAREP